MKKTYKKRYVLGVGYIGGRRNDVSLFSDLDLTQKIRIDFPDWWFNDWCSPMRKKEPKYKLIIERVKPSKAGKEKRT